MSPRLYRLVGALSAFTFALVALLTTTPARADDSKAASTRSTLLNDSGSYMPPKAKPQPTPTVRSRAKHAGGAVKRKVHHASQTAKSKVHRAKAKAKARAHAKRSRKV